MTETTDKNDGTRLCFWWRWLCGIKLIQPADKHAASDSPTPAPAQPTCPKSRRTRHHAATTFLELP